jgi:lipopolysaccharide assembly LptE-like protein
MILRLGNPTRWLAAALGAAALAVSGCGYHFAAEGANLPPQAHSIYVERFENHTKQTGVNDEFMRYLKDEIALHKRLRLADEPTFADLELTGAVNYVTSVPSAFNSANEPTIYGQGISVSAQLIDLHTHKVIWSAHNISNVQHDPVVAQSVVVTTPDFLRQNLRGQDIAKMQDIQVAQTQSAASRDLVMTWVARNLYASMAEGF